MQIVSSARQETVGNPGDDLWPLRFSKIHRGNVRLCDASVIDGAGRTPENGAKAAEIYAIVEF